MVQNITGSSIYSINCAFDADLVSGFLTAMEGFCSEVFNSTGFRTMDLMNLVIEMIQFDGYKMMLFFDKEGNNNRDAVINRMSDICKEEEFTIQRSMQSSERISEKSNFNVKVMDAISNFFSDNFGNDALKEINERMNRMIRYRKSLNLHIQLRLLTAKIKVGEILGEELSIYEDCLKIVSIGLTEAIEDAQYYLNQIKNLIYLQYGTTKSVNGVDWLELYSYIGNFHRILQRITRSEIAEKYLKMATKVINGKGDKNLLQEIAEDVMKMDSDIDMYIKF